MHGRLRRSQTSFPKSTSTDSLRIYTTRPDTLYGVTYLVVAPEHPAVMRLTQPDCSNQVAAYCESASRKSDLDRTDLAKGKTGIFSGSYAIHPLTEQPIAIWIADYVLASYGTGAIMAVPAHDARDREFAETFGLDVVEVIVPDNIAQNTSAQRIFALYRSWSSHCIGALYGSRHFYFSTPRLRGSVGRSTWMPCSQL